MDKPRLCLNEADFLAHDDNVFRVRDNGIRRREKEREESLSLYRRGWLYENEFVSVNFDRGFVIRDMELKKEFEGEMSLRSAVEMGTVYRGVRNSLSWLMD